MVIGLLEETTEMSGIPAGIVTATAADLRVTMMIEGRAEGTTTGADSPELHLATTIPEDLGTIVVDTGMAVDGILIEVHLVVAQAALMEVSGSRGNARGLRCVQRSLHPI